MRKKLFILMLPLLAAGCSPKIPFTVAVQEKYKLNTGDLKKIQFYTSEDIVLYQGSSESKTQTAKGEVVVTNKNDEEKLIIKKGTPCVVTKVDGTDKLFLAFDVGDDKVLLFSGHSTHEPFKLQADEWTGGRGKLTYDGKTYYASGPSAGTYLVFKVKKLDKSKRKQTVVKGRKITE